MGEQLPILEMQIREQTSINTPICRNCRGTYVVPRLEKHRLYAEMCSCFVDKASPSAMVQKRSGASVKSTGSRIVKKPLNPFSLSEYKAIKTVRSRIDAGEALESLASNQKHLDALVSALDKLSNFELALQEYEQQRQSCEFELKENVFENEPIQLNSNLRKRIEQKVHAIRNAHLFSDVIPNGIETLPNQVRQWLMSLTSQNPESLFLYGPPGTGKSTISALATYYAIVNYDILEAVFLTSEETVNAKKESLTASFKADDINSCRYRWNELKRILESVSLVVLDDLGSQKPTETTEAVYTEVINLRYKMRLPTIYTSNHWADGGLKERNLAEKIGARAADRVLGGLLCRVEGPSKRQTIRVDKEAHIDEIFECEKVSPEVKNNFQIKTVEVSETTCMSWLAQNPVFQVISKNEREKLTDSDGADIDVPKRAFHGIVNAEDSLTVWGPVLGMEDQLMYFALVEILQDRHRAGISGTAIRTTFSEIKEKLGIVGDGAKNNSQMMRRIDRLHRSSIKFKSHDKKVWAGGFIDSFVHDGKSRNHSISINLNPFMIRFYDSGVFCRLQLTELQKMSDWSRVLHVYVESLNEQNTKLSLNQFAKLAGKNDFDKKQLAKNARNALEEQKHLGYQSAEAKVERGVIHSFRSRARKDQIL